MKQTEVRADQAESEARALREQLAARTGGTAEAWCRGGAGAPARPVTAQDTTRRGTQARYWEEQSGGPLRPYTKSGSVKHWKVNGISSDDF